ncbi:MAG: substrate-binding domain-containing protein [Luteolibacter sp.]
MKRIAIVVETSLASGRAIVSGISRYLDEHTDIAAFQLSGVLGAMAPNALKNWEGDGIIARIADRKMLDLVLSKELPTIDVLGNVAPRELPLVKCDDRAIGASVADHLMESGHRNFAFVGNSRVRWVKERQAGFFEKIDSPDKPSVFFIDQPRPRKTTAHDEIASLRLWLSTLPTPIGIMVASDQIAPLLFEACHQLSLSIPENVSVVGVDNDKPFCNLCQPRLSSIEPDHSLVGYLAASSLVALMDGKKPLRPVVEISSHILHRRRSSDHIAIADPAVRLALGYIREQAANSPSLDEVGRFSGLSRSVLQRRFRLHVNRTVGEILLAEKLRLAREMLTHTELSLTMVAERSGFGRQEYMNLIFKKHLKTTPAKYRGPKLA